MANDINKEDPHYKGDYGSIYEVNRKFPTGGVAGDFVVIEGWAHYWNADRGTWCVNARRDSYWDELITGIIEKFKLFKGATYMGVAGLDTVPAKAIGAKMYYFATVAGTYKNFGGLVVPQGINVLYSENGSSWVCSTLLEVAQELGVSTNKVVSQKALNDALAKKFDKESVVQTTGVAEDKVMSQKAVSDKLSDLSESIGTEQLEHDFTIGSGIAGYIDATGTFQAQSGSTANRVYRVDNLTDIAKVYAKSYDDSANNKQFKHIAFYDKSERYVGGVDFSDSMVEHIADVPTNANYALVFTHNNSVKPIVKVTTKSSGIIGSIDTLNGNIEGINKQIDTINKEIDGIHVPEVVQETGDANNMVMSQKAVSDELNNLSDTIGTKSSEESVILGQGLTGYIDATGTFQAQSGSTDNRVYRVDNLSNIKSIYAKSYEDSANNKQFKHIAFYDKSENYIDGVDFSDGLVEHTIIVPSNASYAYVFTHNDSIKPTVNIIAGGTGVYAEIDSINENIDVINAKIEDIENVTENPNTKIQSYSTYVRNPTNVGGETPIQFICRFKYGEATSPSKLRVRDNEGNYYPCQWEDVSSVNPAVDFVNGRWSDGSLRSGKLWIIANLPANKLSTFYIDILQEDQNVVQTVFYDASRLYCSKKSFILDTNGFNGSYYPCIMDNKTGNTINIHKSSDIKNKQITTEGNGVVYLDYTVRFHYKNLLFVEKYRLFYNGELYVHIYCTALEDVSCYSIHVDYYTPDKELSYVNNTVTYVKYQNSDVQTLVSLISISMDNLRAGNYSVLPSYFSVTNNHFYTGFRANGDIEIFKKGLSVSFYFKEANSPIDNYHYLQYLEPTGCTTKTPYGFNKVKIKNICKSILLSTYVVMERMVGETNKTLICHNVPSVIMRGIERYNGFKLTDSSMYFKADIKEILGADVITLDIIKGQWNNSNIGFQHLNRFIPFAYNIWMYLEDDSEKEYYHNLLQCYGDFVSWVYETYNNIPLTKDNVVNSNSLASGLLALSMAYKVTGNEKYKTLYTSVEKTYMAEPYNIMGYMDNDTNGASVSLQRYLHYQAYSRFTYLLSKYVIQEDNYPNLDVASTILMGIDSDGNPLDQEYTCSDSRRGSVQTLAYIIGILCGTPELDYQSQLGEICVERLKECFNGNNTEKFPINGFLNKGNTSLSDLVIVNGILLQMATII